MMKSIFTLLTTFTLFLCLSANTIAQSDSLYYDIGEESRKMSEGEHTALTIYVPEADEEQAKDVWNNYMDQFDAKTKKGWFSSEFHTEEAHIYSIGGVDPVDVYATFNESEGGIEGVVWFRLSESVYLNSTAHENSFNEAKRFVDNFGIALKQRVLKSKMEVEQEQLEELEKEMKDLKENKEDLNETIKEAKETISTSEEKLKENASAIEEMTDNLEDQQNAVQQARRKYNSSVE